MSKLLLNVLLGVALAASGAAIAQEKKAQEKKAAPAKAPEAKQAEAKPSAGGDTRMCIGCHGIPGYKTAYPEVYHVPKIAGQQPAYIVNALKAYRSGERAHPSMRGIAASLTDEDMAALAAYYGGAK